jgi:hypothetical protein
MPVNKISRYKCAKAAIASAIAAARLPDGRIAVVANLPGGPRDPLYLAIFDATIRIRIDFYYVRQGVNPYPTYPREYHGGAAYPGIWVGG